MGYKLEGRGGILQNATNGQFLKKKKKKGTLPHEGHELRRSINNQGWK
jgi:hypothetical protein